MLGHDYVSLLSAPPRRGESDLIDPWSAGRDPLARGTSSTFAERYRGGATSTPTASSLRSIAPHRSHRRPGSQRLCSRHLGARMKLLFLFRPLSLVMLLDPRLCAQGRPTCRSRRGSEIGCCRHVPASSRRALARRRFILFLVRLKHMLSTFHFSLSKLCLRRAPATSLLMAGPKHRSRCQTSGSRLPIYVALVVSVVRQ